MDINLFELAGKTVRRTAESVQDAGMFAEHCLWQNLPFTPENGDLGYAREASKDIFKAAGKALEHNDMEEAGHQLRREVYFCSIVDELAGGSKELAAQAGLKAIAAGLPALEVTGLMNQAAKMPKSLGVVPSKPEAADMELKQIVDWANTDIHGLVDYHSGLKHQQSEAIAHHRPWYHVAGQEATLALGVTDYMLSQGELNAARGFYGEAEQYIKAAGQSKAEVQHLEPIQKQVARHLAEYEDTLNRGHGS